MAIPLIVPILGFIFGAAVLKSDSPARQLVASNPVAHNGLPLDVDAPKPLIDQVNTLLMSEGISPAHLNMAAQVARESGFPLCAECLASEASKRQVTRNVPDLLSVLRSPSPLRDDQRAPLGTPIERASRVEVPKRPTPPRPSPQSGGSGFASSQSLLDRL